MAQDFVEQFPSSLHKLGLHVLLELGWNQLSTFILCLSDDEPHLLLQAGYFREAKH